MKVTANNRGQLVVVIKPYHRGKWNDNRVITINNKPFREYLIYVTKGQVIK